MVPSINGDNMKTIAQQLNIKTFPFEIMVDGNVVYLEASDGEWEKSEYQDGNCVYYENSNDYWWKREYQDDNIVYFEDSEGYWSKREYQDGNRETRLNRVYFENSDGYIEDNRPKSKAQAKVAEARKLLEEAERELKETT